MKKNIFLGLLPALLVLASCQAAPKVEPKAELENIIEDTEAHDEIFGESKLVGNLGIRKAYDGDVEVPEDTGVAYPNLGIQTKKGNGADGIADTADDTISIRFVAAIQVGDVNLDGDITDADLAATTVSWRRTIFKNDGTVSIASADKASTKAYTSLAAPDDVEDDGIADNILTIEEFNAAKLGRSYTHFVVYTMLDLPLTYGNYYTVVDVSVNGGGSEILATTIDQTTQFVFEPYVNAHPLNNHYFAIKKSASGFDVIDPAATPGDGNFARFEGASFDANDSFVIVHRVVGALGSNSDIFKVYGFDQLRRGAQFLPKVADSNFIKASGTGSYNLYLTDFNQIYAVTPDSAKASGKYYFKPGSSWTEASPRYALYVYNDSAKTEDWFYLEEVGSTGVYSCAAFSAITWPNCIFCRMDPGNLTNGWSQKWTQTKNLSTDDEGNIFYVNNDASTAGNVNADGNWNHYPVVE